MKTTIFLIPFLWLSLLNAKSQTGIQLSPGARAAGMGNTSLTFQNAHSLFGNPSGISHLKNNSALAAMSQPFLISELRTLGFGIALPSQSGTFGLKVNQFGFEAYKEQLFGLVYARKLFKDFAVGIGFDYLNVRIPEYGKKGAITFEIGFQAQLGREWILATHLFSPVKIDFSQNEPIPTIFKIGGAYFPSSKVLFAAEIEKDLSHPARFNSGIEYKLTKGFSIRTGVRTAPVNFSFGTGMNLGNGLELDFAFNYHPVLGISPSVGISFKATQIPSNQSDRNRQNPKE